jgi:Domain of unknown function DUF11
MYTRNDFHGTEHGSTDQAYDRRLDASDTKYDPWLGCAAGRSYCWLSPLVPTVGWASAARTGDRVRADLSVQIVGAPSETRVGGTVAYRAIVRNVGRLPAKDISLALETTPLLAAVSASRMVCKSTPVRGVFCTAAALRPREAARVELTVRALALGRLVVTASASSESREATQGNNRASLVTPVRPADTVLVQATHVAPDGFRQEIVLDAISARRGEDPDGTLNMVWAGERSTGRVTSVHVSGNRAAVGIFTPPTTPPPPDAKPTPYLLFVLTDNGSPGVGRDTFSLLGGGGPRDPFRCLLFSLVAQTGPTVIPITTGDITIVDTP